MSNPYMVLSRICSGARPPSFTLPFMPEAPFVLDPESDSYKATVFEECISIGRGIVGWRLLYGVPMIHSLATPSTTILLENVQRTFMEILLRRTSKD